MAVAPVGFTLWCAAAGCAAVQPAACPPLGPGLLAGQAVPSFGSTPGCQPQAQRFSRVPFHRVDPGFLGRPHVWGGWQIPRSLALHGSRSTPPAYPAKLGFAEILLMGSFGAFGSFGTGAGQPKETVGLVRVPAMHLGHHGSFSLIGLNPGGSGW